MSTEIAMSSEYDSKSEASTSFSLLPLHTFSLPTPLLLLLSLPSYKIMIQLNQEQYKQIIWQY